MDCVSVEILKMEISKYPEFLNLRQKLMAQKMREYYLKL